MFDEITIFSTHEKGNLLCDVYTDNCLWHHENVSKTPFTIYGIASVCFMLVPTIFGSLFALGDIGAWANQTVIVLAYVGSFA